MTTVSDGLYQYGGVPVPVAFTGKAYFVDPVAGSDGNSGKSVDQAFKTLYKAHAACTSGNNDTVYLIGNGAATGTARLSLANAVAVDSTATTGTLVWSKDATHLIGVAAPSNNRRARMAPPTGTYAQSTFNALPFVTVSGNGCLWQNVAIYNGFSTGANGQIALNVTGGRNTFDCCDILGMNDAASAQGTASRSVVVTGTTGENVFRNCMIGGDTTTRTVANASLELAGGTPRNSFIDCTFPFQTSSAGVLGILGTGASCIDRWTEFRNCTFVNNIKSTSTTMTVLASLTSASPGGLLMFTGSTGMIGIGEFGDTNGVANSYVMLPAPSASAGGIGVNPS